MKKLFSTSLLILAGMLLLLGSCKEDELWGIERSGFFNGREKWVKGFENQMV